MATVPCDQLKIFKRPPPPETVRVSAYPFNWPRAFSKTLPD